MIASAEQTAQRFKDQKPHPDSEAALRQMLAGLASGKPDYERMAPRLAEVTRAQLPGLQKQLAELGALKTLKFVRVAPAGDDEYDADFENGGLRTSLRLNDEGRIESAWLRPGQAGFLARTHCTMSD